MRIRSQNRTPRRLDSTIRKYSVGEIDYSYDLRTYNYAGDVFDASAQDSDIVGISYSADGAYLFILGNNSNTIYSYALCPYFDITSASLEDSLDYSGYTTNAADFVFSDDGTTVGIVDSSGVVYVYELGTDWDLSTGTYSSTTTPGSTLIDIVSVDQNSDGDYIVMTSGGSVYNVTTPTVEDPYDIINSTSYAGTYTTPGIVGVISFGNNGYMVYEYGGYPVWIKQYSTSVPYNIDNLTYISTLSTGTINNLHLWFDSSGTHLIAGGGVTMEHWVLSIPWKISTAVLQDSPTFTYGIEGLWLNPGGTRIYYVLGTTTLYIRDLDIAFDITSIDDDSGTDTTMTGSAYVTIWISSDGNYLYVANYQGYIRFYHFSDGPWGEVPVYDGTTRPDGLSVQGEFRIAVNDAGSMLHYYRYYHHDVYEYNIGTAANTELFDASAGAASSGQYYLDGYLYMYLDPYGPTVMQYWLTAPYSFAIAEPVYNIEIEDVDLSNATIIAVTSHHAILCDNTTGEIFYASVGY